MQAGLACELGVEGHDEHRILPRRDRLPIDLGEYLDAGPMLGDPGSANEDRSQRLIESPQLDIGLEAPDLTTERVTPRPDVHETEVIAVEHDQASTGAEDRRSAGGQIAQRHRQTVALDPQRHRRRLSAGQNERVQPVQIGGHAHFASTRAERSEQRGVRLEVPLQGEDPD